MIENILPGIFRIELPLSNISLQTVNCYLIKGKTRDLVIDSGMNEQGCKLALAAALQELDARLENIDYFITHLHEDHFGLAPDMASRESTIYLNAPETRFWGDPNRWEQGLIYGIKNGFPEEELRKFISKRPKFLNKLPLDEIVDAIESYENNCSPKGRLQIIGDGETLNVGDYSFRCIVTPGHSSGHICLYEPDKNLLFSGDHLLETITPAIFLWPGENRNPLREYLNSLDRVAALDVSTILPGHRNTFKNHLVRIAELKKHHYHREREIVSILDDNGKSAYEIASRVSWNIPLPWEQFTTGLKWMALAETLAHLKYLESSEKVISKLESNNIDYYFL